MTTEIGDFTGPVLRVCPIPHHVVGFIGGNHGGRPRYLLWKDGQEITVEVPHHDYEAEYDPSDPYALWKILEKSLQTFGHYLEIIQMHLNEIRFGETNWAYLLKDRHGGFYIRQREKVFRKVTCPLWAPIILEDEIQFTVWGQPWDRRGIWNGLEVDVLYAWSEDNVIRLDRAMRAHRVLTGMDLTFEVYGHLLRQDTVIGLVTEAAKGRMLKSSDRSLIYRTIATIQGRGCLYRGCGTNQFMITPEGKVRLLEMFSLVQYPPDQWDKLAKDAELWHWTELGELFQEFKTHGPYGDCRFPPDRLTASPRNLQLIAPLPGPERPLGGLYLYPSPNFFVTYHIPLWDGFELAPWMNFGRHDDQHLRQRSIANGKNSPSGTDVSSESDVDDRPLNVLEISLYRTQRGVQRRARVVFHPYRANRNRDTVIISRSDDTENSSNANYVCEL